MSSCISNPIVPSHLNCILDLPHAVHGIRVCISCPSCLLPCPEVQKIFDLSLEVFLHNVEVWHHLLLPELHQKQLQWIVHQDAQMEMKYFSSVKHRSSRNHKHVWVDRSFKGKLSIVAACAFQQNSKMCCLQMSSLFCRRSYVYFYKIWNLLAYPATGLSVPPNSFRGGPMHWYSQYSRMVNTAFLVTCTCRPENVTNLQEEPAHWCRNPHT